VYQVGFIIRIYHVAPSPEYQKKQRILFSWNQPQEYRHIKNIVLNLGGNISIRDRTRAPGHWHIFLSNYQHILHPISGSGPVVTSSLHEFQLLEWLPDGNQSLFIPCRSTRPLSAAGTNKRATLRAQSSSNNGIKSVREWHKCSGHSDPQITPCSAKFWRGELWASYILFRIQVLELCCFTSQLNSCFKNAIFIYKLLSSSNFIRRHVFITNKERKNWRN